MIYHLVHPALRRPFCPAIWPLLELCIKIQRREPIEKKWSAVRFLKGFRFCLKESFGSLVQKELSNRGGIWAPILCNRCLGATARSWPLAYQVSAGQRRSLATKLRVLPLRPQTRRIPGRCNQRCIHQPQSNHQSDLQHSNIKKKTNDTVFEKD